MNYFYYKYKDENDRENCMMHLKKSGFWNDIEIDIEKSVTKRLTISIEKDLSEDFYSKLKYKGFIFNEISD